MADAVKETDHGWGKMVKAVAAADGLELRVGQLDPRIRYPKSGTGTPGQQVGKVAGIHGIHKAISQGYEDSKGNTEAAFAEIQRALVEGKAQGIADLIYRRMGAPMRDRMREAAYSIVKRRSGRLGEAIRATVFEGGRVGSRGAASSGKVAAGDDPKRPRATEAIG